MQDLRFAVHSRIQSIDRDQPVQRILTLEQCLADSLAPQRMNMRLSGALGALALVLAAIGIYGLFSFLVEERTHEIGVRMALGAQTPDLLKMVLGQGLRLALAGGITGLAAAVGLTRFLRSLLYGVSCLDPLTFLGVSLFLLLVALAACYLPARRACRVDPLVAIRYE